MTVLDMTIRKAVASEAETPRRYRATSPGSGTCGRSWPASCRTGRPSAAGCSNAVHELLDRTIVAERRRRAGRLVRAGAGPALYPVSCS